MRAGAQVPWDWPAERWKAPRRLAAVWAVGVLLGVALLGRGELSWNQTVIVRGNGPAFVSIPSGEGTQAVILEGPSGGALLGAPPNLVYVPRPGFAGTDWVTYAATSPGGTMAIGTVKLVVLGPGDGTMAMPVLLSEGELRFSGPTFAVDGYRFVLGLHQRFRYFEQGVRATWTEAGFTSWVATTRVELEGSAPSPWRLPITSTMVFNPTVPGLGSWTVDARTTLFGATWIYTGVFSGTDPQTGSYSSAQVQGKLDPLAFDLTVRLETLTPTFGSLRFALRGPWLCEGCPTQWEAELLYRKTGFDRLTAVIRGIELPCPVCTGFRLLLDTKVTFALTEKRLEPALRLESFAAVCLRPLVALPTPSSFLGFEGLSVYGFELSCELAGYRLRSATSFDPSRDGEVTGDARFFELWQLEGPVAPCCGAPGRFQVSLYFKRDSGNLFGLGMATVILHVPLSRELSIQVGWKGGEVESPPSAKTWALTWGWRGIW